MSMHVEWTSSPGAIRLLTKEEATEELQPDEEITGDYVLVVGGEGGGCAAVEGSLQALSLDLASALEQLAEVASGGSTE